MSNPYPNPVRLGSTVRVNLLSSCPVTADWSVYTLAYRKVYGERVEVNGPKTAAWNLRDDKGVPVGAGLYFLKFEALGGNPVLRKVMVGD